LTEEIKTNQEKLQAYAVQIDATNKMLEEAEKQYGINSQQAIQYRDKLLDLQIAQTKLAQATAQANDELQKQSQYPGLNDIYGNQITSQSSHLDYVQALLMQRAEQGAISTQQFIQAIQSLPKYASGGIVSQPTVALVGEAGPEAIVPLNGSSSGNLQQTIHDATYQATYQALIDVMKVKSVSNSNDNKEITIRIDTASSNMLARILLPAIIREGQRQGLNLVLQGVTN
jgi:hypothetical protein